jgi:hypothetical protein
LKIKILEQSNNFDKNIYFLKIMNKKIIKSSNKSDIYYQLEIKEILNEKINKISSDEELSRERINSLEDFIIQEEKNNDPEVSSPSPHKIEINI